jgi:hypothetical protein
MKIALGFAAVILLATVPAQGQARGGASRTTGGGGAGSYGGGALSGTSSFSTLGPVAPSNSAATNVSGTDATFLPSRFVTFAAAVEQGNANIKEESKTVVQAAAEARKKATAPAKVVVMQDNDGNIIYSTN